MSEEREEREFLARALSRDAKLRLIKQRLEKALHRVNGELKIINNVLAAIA
jgi:hypothetical protein